jgi:hypothetical protein
MVTSLPLILTLPLAAAGAEPVSILMSPDEVEPTPDEMLTAAVVAPSLVPTFIELSDFKLSPIELDPTL